MNKIPVSVIIPCYNCADVITRATDSILQQTYLPQELILVDDCSSDNGATIGKLYAIEQYFGEILNIIVLKLDANQGPANARNAGWDIATQPYIAFLDSDDAWHKEKLQVQYNWMCIHSEVLLTGHEWHQYSKSSNIKFSSLLEYDVKATKIDKKKLLFKNFFATPTVMLKKDIPFRFEKNKRYAEDYLLWLKIALYNNNLYFLKLPLTFIFKAAYGEGGLTAQLWNMEKGELDAYSRLYNKKHLNKITLRFIQTFSLMKYGLRLFKVLLRKI